MFTYDPLSLPKDPNTEDQGSVFISKSLIKEFQHKDAYLMMGPIQWAWGTGLGLSPALQHQTKWSRTTLSPMIAASSALQPIRQRGIKGVK